MLFSKLKQITMRKLGLFFLLFLPFAGFAQERVTGMSFFFNGGIHHMNNSELNEAFDAAGYEGNFRSLHYMGGGGLHFYLNNFVIGTRARMLSVDRRRSPENTVSYTTGSGNMFLGYILNSGPRHLLFPGIGFGAVSSALIVRPRQVQASFNDVISNPDEFGNQASRLIHITPFIRPAIHFDYFPVVRERDGGSRGLLVGISAGYTFSRDAQWTLGGSRIATAPEFNPSGFFVSLRVGAGAFIRR
jgi:hypothetical protein